MNNKELTEGLQAEARAQVLSDKLKKTSPAFMDWLDKIMWPFVHHGQWILAKYKEENK